MDKSDSNKQGDGESPPIIAIPKEDRRRHPRVLTEYGERELLEAYFRSNTEPRRKSPITIQRRLPPTSQA